MTRAYFSDIVPAPVDQVWAVLGRFEAISDFVHKLTAGEIENGPGPVVGSVRLLTLRGGGQVRERLVSMDAADRSYRYEFPEGQCPFPVRSYLATIRVRPVTTQDATFVEWYGDYDCDADVVESMRETFAGRYSEFIGNLHEYLQLSRPDGQS